MCRSIHKGPFVEGSLLRQVRRFKNSQGKGVIYIWSRKSTILLEFVGIPFKIHTGKKFESFTPRESSVGMKFGAFIDTRKLVKHSSDKSKSSRVRKSR